MSPFETYSLKPFLKLDSAKKQKLHSSYLKFSAQYHPDNYVMEADEAKEKAEEKFSLYNVAYKILLDNEQRFHCFLEVVCPQVLEEHSKNKIAPKIAFEYFEVVEGGDLELMKKFNLKVNGQKTQLLEKWMNAEESINEIDCRTMVQDFYLIKYLSRLEAQVSEELS